MKTILQVQLENPEMRSPLPPDNEMILERSVDSPRNESVAQSAGRGAQGWTASAMQRVRGGAEVVVFSPERSAKVLRWSFIRRYRIACGHQHGVVNDILTNLVVNAMDAAARGGKCRWEFRRRTQRTTGSGR